MNAKTKERIPETTEGSAAPTAPSLSSSSQRSLQELEISSAHAHYIFEDDNNSEHSAPLLPGNDSDDDVLFALLGATTIRFPSRGVAAAAEDDKESSSESSSLQHELPTTTLTTTAATTTTLTPNPNEEMLEQSEGTTDVTRPETVSTASSEDDDEEEDFNDEKERAPRRKSKSGLLGRFKPSSGRSRLFGGKQQQSLQIEVMESSVDGRSQHVDDDLGKQPRSLPTERGSLRSSGTGVAETASSVGRSTNQSITSSVVTAILKEQRKHENATVAAVCQDGLDGRWSADTVATALQLGEDAEQLLGSLRGRSGAVFMGEDVEDCEGSKDNVAGVPDLHVAEDVWIPHYEEYVVRMVDAFGRFLGISSSPG